ncbi:ABC transporter permease [Frigoribacterium faeni]|uniref:Autoinducer 2 import system permease protein LsrD n=1 Tax=Frigoribacterium faeni TaxID=145483 RepID=A0A7W3JIZ6_9MICO|nr:ABC transporter permease [Frigoribacterium faeni]MBA8813744.1 rhamnose transport system permease protein [Frigoribacterium faeni]BFF15045.1 ABC transporter permease [Microbacterium flavescens]GEK83391.1 sugar ABC transporter permease [Frigoribacterium faeni]
MPDQTTTSTPATGVADAGRASSAPVREAPAIRRDPESAAERKLRRRRRLTGRGAIMIYALLGTLIVCALTVPRFASVQTTGFLLLDAIPILMIAMPMALVIITGEIDLSVASTAGLTSAAMGVLWAAGWGIPEIFVVCVLIGIGCGALNGLLVTAVGLPSLAVTIGTLALYRGLALVVIGDNAVANFPPALTAFFTSKIGGTGIPTVMIGVAVIVVFFGVLLHFSSFGRALPAIGFSKEAASFVGVRVGRAKFWMFVATGVVSALVGIYWTLRYSSARSDNATGIELAVIAAVLLGGVSIFGGRGSIPGVVAGVLIISSVSYALRLGGISDVVLNVVTGLLLVGSVVAPSLIAVVRERRRSRRAARDVLAASAVASA